MTAPELLNSLKENGALLHGDLDADVRDEAVAALHVMRDELAAGRAPGAAHAVRRLRRALSALPDGHPVAEHLGGGRRYAAEAPQLPSAALVGEVIGILGEPPPGPEELRRTARERLLAAPALSPDEHADLRSGPAGLIRLNDPSGARYPRFQFRPGTAEPLPVVQRINALLQADRDPWGAADWWLGGNVWLGGVPAELLGTLPDDALERAAAELVEAD